MIVSSLGANLSTIALMNTLILQPIFSWGRRPSRLSPGASINGSWPNCILSVALLHHGFYWSCPDKEALSAALRSAALRATQFSLWLFRGRLHRHDGGAHLTDCRMLTYFVAPQRGRPGAGT